MGRSKVVFERNYCPDLKSYNFFCDPPFKDFCVFLEEMIWKGAIVMHDKQETIGNKLVEYWIFGMEEGVVVYRMESGEGEQAFSRARVTIWPNSDEQSKGLEFQVRSALPYRLVGEPLEFGSMLLSF